MRFLKDVSFSLSWTHLYCISLNRVDLDNCNFLTLWPGLLPQMENPACVIVGGNFPWYSTRGKKTCISAVYRFMMKFSYGVFRCVFRQLRTAVLALEIKQHSIKPGTVQLWMWVWAAALMDVTDWKPRVNLCEPWCCTYKWEWKKWVWMGQKWPDLNLHCGDESLGLLSSPVVLFDWSLSGVVC